MGKAGGLSVRWLAIAATTVLLSTFVTFGVVSPATAAGESTIFSLVNQSRAANGLGPLKLNSAISAVSAAWAQQMAANHSMTHNPSYSSQIPSGWTKAAENIAMGYSSPQAVHEAWMGSTGHRANILGDYTDIGISFITMNGTTWAVENFGKYGPSVPPPATPDQTFADVGPTHPFFSEIEWMASEGISTGTAQPSGRPLYEPRNAVSRQAMAAFLYRFSGDAFTAPVEPTFADVPTSSPFYTAIEWMSSSGISTGTPQGVGKPLYKPGDPVSRAAMAAFLYRYLGVSTTGPTTSPFSDVPTSSTFYKYIAWMYSSGLSHGYDDGAGRPLYKANDQVSRQAMAAFLFRTAEG